MTEWEMMERPREWLVYSLGYVADKATVADGMEAIDGYVAYLRQHRVEYGYPDDYNLTAVCPATAERIQARGTFNG